jgi:hypothetical protein
MKKTINGKTYNTETAEEITYTSSHLYTNDFGYWSETLHKTKKGNYFLYGSGGAMSKYSEPCGNNGRCGGSDIIPLTMDEALEWCEEHDEQEAIEREFSLMVEEA